MTETTEETAAEAAREPFVSLDVRLQCESTTELVSAAAALVDAVPGLQVVLVAGDGSAHLEGRWAAAEDVIEAMASALEEDGNG